MGAGGVPGGGITRVYGRVGSLPKIGKPNSRVDLYNSDGVRIQSRWYDSRGIVIRNRDYLHSDKYGNHTFPHDHIWVFHGYFINKFGELDVNVERLTQNLEPDFINFPDEWM